MIDISFNEYSQYNDGLPSDSRYARPEWEKTAKELGLDKGSSPDLVKVRPHIMRFRLPVTRMVICCLLGQETGRDCERYLLSLPSPWMRNVNVSIRSGHNAASACTCMGG